MVAAERLEMAVVERLTVPPRVFIDYPILLQTRPERALRQTAAHRLLPRALCPGLYLADIVDGWSKVMCPVCERAVRAVLDAVAARVCLVYARACLVVAQVVAALRVARSPMEVRTSTTMSYCSVNGSDVRRSFHVK